MKPALPIPTVERLFVYHKVLTNLLIEGTTHVFSYDLANRARNTAAQVRRDLMSAGCVGSSGKGYDIRSLLDRLSEVLEHGASRQVIVIGLGNIGKGLISYFSSPNNEFSILAAFDRDTRKTGKPFQECPCFPIADLEPFLEKNKVELAVLAVPGPVAQVLSDRLVMGGVRGILNFAPVRLAVPKWVHVEDNHITMMLKKVSYLAKLSPDQVKESLTTVG